MRIPDHIRRHLVTLLPGRDDVRALPRTWRRDVLAGLTVGVVALPLALAFGVSSGMGAAAGLVTAIVAGVVAAVFGGIGIIPGALIGAYFIGGVETLVSALGYSLYRDGVVFAILIVMLIVKPTGLLGKNVREKV